MKYIPSIAFEEMSGSAKGVFKQLSQAWKGLTNAQILAWNAAANTAKGRSVLGTKSNISGCNLFMRLNYWGMYCCGSIMTAVPTLSGIEASADATVVLSSSAMTFQLADIPSDVTNLKLIIQASEPQGNGITRAYSKAAAFGEPLTPVSTAIDIKSDNDEKCGAPSAGYPKAFFRYFYVNTATGEKSGEKMASAVLSAYQLPGNRHYPLTTKPHAYGAGALLCEELYLNLEHSIVVL